jgi:hypothetical protein
MAGFNVETAQQAARAKEAAQNIDKEIQSIVSKGYDRAVELLRANREKLDQYLTGIREIETRIAKAERFGAGVDPNRDTPPGVPTDYGQHMELMFDMMALAFQTDSDAAGVCAALALAGLGDTILALAHPRLQRVRVDQDV